MASEDGQAADHDPWNKEMKTKFRAKSMSHYIDPCQEAAAKSIRCLHRNGGDRTMCTDYFQDCKKEWILRRRGPPEKEDERLRSE